MNEKLLSELRNDRDRLQAKCSSLDFDINNLKSKISLHDFKTIHSSGVLAGFKFFLDKIENHKPWWKRLW